jgi:cytochrome c peroxidase
MYKNLVYLLLPLSVHALEVLPKKVPVPADNPITPAKIELGRQLYHDARLSLDNTVSCNSCHNVIGNNSGGVDNKPTSAGVKGQLGGRNSPTVLNAAFMSVQFWDGRATSLEDQAKGPLTNPIEMSMPSHDMVIERISKLPGYVEQFKKVFGTDKITIDHVAKAIATYERTLITPKSQVDQYVAGNKRALSSSAIRGLKLVESVGCLSCHSGPNYAGPAMSLGTGFYQKFPLIPNAEYEAKYGFSKDLGRYEVTKSDSDKNLFRVPTWRNIALTAPYFHNGKVETLDEAVKVMAKTQLNRDLKDQEVKDIVAFLNGLTGKRKAETMPKLPQ